MTKLFIFIGTTIGSYAGWAAADALGCGIMGCFVVSGIASIAGVFFGWKIAQRIEG